MKRICKNKFDLLRVILLALAVILLVCIILPIR